MSPEARKARTMTIAVTQTPTEAEPGYLLGTATVSGVPFHVEAIRVTEDAEGAQCAADANNHARLESLYDTQGEGPFRTVSIPGHHGAYVVWLTPYQG